MARYIDADAFKRKLIDEKSFFPALVASALKEMPTADVVEVKHGYWKTVTETKDNTVCGDSVKIQYKICSNCEEPMGLTGTDYCGWCGAKMDGGNNG